MNPFSNISRRIYDSARIAGLGRSLPNKIWIFGELVLRSVAHTFPSLRQFLPQESDWKCRYNGVAFSLVLSGRHDEYMLVKEIFIDHLYALDATTPVSTIVDCGANIGITTLYFHARFPNARIIAVEPSPAVFGRLVRMTKNIDNVTPVHAAIGEGEGSTSFFIEEASQASSLMRRSEQARKVEMPMISLPVLLERHGVSYIDLLKFDIEGAEEYLFSTQRSRTAIRSFIGEVHEDLMTTPLNAFMSSLEPDFSFTIVPTRKRHRYIIRGTHR